MATRLNSIFLNTTPLSLGNQKKPSRSKVSAVASDRLSSPAASPAFGLQSERVRKIDENYESAVNVSTVLLCFAIILKVLAVASLGPVGWIALAALTIYLVASVLYLCARSEALHTSNPWKKVLWEFFAMLLFSLLSYLAPHVFPISSFLG